MSRGVLIPLLCFCWMIGSAQYAPPVQPDGHLRDGDEIRLGGVVLTAHFTPGHTKGCTAYTTTVRENGASYRGVFPCSLSAPGYQLVDNPLYPGIVEDFESTFARLRALPCDIFIAPHTSAFVLLETSRARKDGGGANPFVDPDGYRRWLDNAQAAFRKQLGEQRKRGTDAPAGRAPPSMRL